MNLEQQLQILINDASESGIPTVVMEQAVIPILHLYAAQLQHGEYYVLQTLDEDWVLSAIANREQPQLEKKVVYAFATLKDAANFQGTADAQVIAISVPVTHILFQMFAQTDVDSIIFMETPGNLNQGCEVNRANLQNLIGAQIEQLGKSPGRDRIPPDFA